MVSATQEVRPTGLLVAVAPGRFPDFFGCSVSNLVARSGRGVAVENFQELAVGSWAQLFKEGRRYLVRAGGPFGSHLS